MQKFDYGITVIFEKINGNTVIYNLVRPPPNICVIHFIFGAEFEYLLIKVAAMCYLTAFSPSIVIYF